MKKGLKITLISLSSLIGLVLVALGIVLFLIFTPARLTSIVNKEIPKYITCDFHLEKADLTLFKTFPKVGVELHDLVLVNPVNHAPTDTLLSVDRCIAAINIRELLKNERIIVQNFYLKNGNANIFINENNQSNLDIFKTDTTKPRSEFTYMVDLQKVVTENVNVSFVNLYSGMQANLNDLDLNVKGKWADNNVTVDKIKINTKDLVFNTLDSNALTASYDKMKFRFKGDLADMNCLNGSLNLDVNQLLLQVDTDKYVDAMDVSVSSDANFLLNEQKVRLENTRLTLDKFKIDLNGTAQRNVKDDALVLDLNYKTGSWKLQDVLAAIPRAIIGSALDKMEMDGKIALSGRVYGHCNATQKPIITADVDWTDGIYALDGFPLTFQKINTVFNLNMDLNHQTDVTVKKLNCVTRNNKLAASGTIKDLLNEMIFDVKLDGDLHVPDFADLLPEVVKINAADAKASLKAHFNIDQLSNLQFDKMTASGNFQFKNLDVVYNDSIMVKSPDMSLDLRFPVSEHPYNIGEWVETKVVVPHLYGQKVDFAEISAEDVDVTAYLNDIMDSTTSFKVGAVYNFSKLAGKMDTIDVQLSKPKGSFVLKDHNNMTLKYIGESLLAHIGKNMTAATNNLNIHANTDYHEQESTALMKWNPNVKLNLKNGNLVMNSLDVPIEIPNIKVDLDARQCNIQEGSVKIGNSDITLKGEIHNIDKYFHGQDLMKGELELTSNLLDINQIMDLVQGFGAPDSLKKEKPQDGEDNPFIVPFGFDLYMHTIIKKALYEDVAIRNMSGDVTVRDGVLVLEEMGFTHEAARMQLTALYKTPRKNHLFLGLDFHLLDIKIDQLINMFPQVDTVLPMLKSFSGNAEFHFAIETYLKSNYDLKYSTLRGAAAINGQNLVVLDNETYRNISKKLLFNKKTKNVIDSLSAEATIYKNEVDVYPFTVGIDKYQAILSGRHNLDMTYNYNISLIKPLRLGLDIIADTESRKFKLTKAKYATMYRPEKRNVVEDHVMQLKTLINTSLKRNVKEQPKEF